LTDRVKAHSLYGVKSRISSKGQITVPREIREQLGLNPGTVVEFELREGRAVLRKGSRGQHPVDAVYGSIELDRPVDRLLDEMRGPRPREEEAARSGRRPTGRRKR
jgi:AbrB family looped-hinge helix DNA binding protein